MNNLRMKYLMKLLILMRAVLDVNLKLLVHLSPPDLEQRLICSRCRLKSLEALLESEASHPYLLYQLRRRFRNPNKPQSQVKARVLVSVLVLVLAKISLPLTFLKYQETRQIESSFIL